MGALRTLQRSLTATAQLWGASRSCALPRTPVRGVCQMRTSMASKAGLQPTRACSTSRTSSESDQDNGGMPYAFHASARLPTILDTQEEAEKLVAAGTPPGQARETISAISRERASKLELQKLSQHHSMKLANAELRFLESIGELRNELKTMENLDFRQLRSETERANNALEGRLLRLENESKMLESRQSTMQTDLERKIEAHLVADLQKLRTELELFDTRRNFTREVLEKKVEAQVFEVQTELERLENRLIKYAIGVGSTMSLLVLGFLRLMM